MAFSSRNTLIDSPSSDGCCPSESHPHTLRWFYACSHSALVYMVLPCAAILLHTWWHVLASFQFLQQYLTCIAIIVPNLPLVIQILLSLFGSFSLSSYWPTHLLLCSDLSSFIWFKSCTWDQRNQFGLLVFTGKLGPTTFPKIIILVHPALPEVVGGPVAVPENHLSPAIL